MEKRRTRPVRVALLTAAAVTAAVAIGLVGGQVADRPKTIPVSDDVSVQSWAPGAPDADQAVQRARLAVARPPGLDLPDRLAAGGLAGGAAISYLRFRVDLPAGAPPAHAELWLARHSGRLPEVVELSTVPWTTWQSRSLTGRTAPRLGRVIGSVFPTGYEAAVHFDVTNVLRSSGEYAFAVTAPTGDAVGLFVSQESDSGRAPMLTLQWDVEGVAGSSSAALKRLPGGVLVAPPVTGVLNLELPGWLPEEAAPAYDPTLPPSTASAPPSPPPPPRATPGSPSPSAGTPSDQPSSTGSPQTEPSPSEPSSVEPSPAGPSPAEPSPVEPSPIEPSPSDAPQPSPIEPSPTEVPQPSPTDSPEPSPSDEPSPSGEPNPTGEPSPTDSPAPSSTTDPSNAAPSPSASPTDPDCYLGELAVPTCGVLWGVAPGAHTGVDRITALRTFESTTGRPQAIYHAYHRGESLFPTQQEIAIARDPHNPRMLMLNWKPVNVTWRELAQGDPWADAYLDRLAKHIKATYRDPFFFTMHHEPEDDVRTNPVLGMTAKDFANAFRHVVLRLRAKGVDNLISAVCYMAYVPWNAKSWFTDLYPGDDVVDWISWDAYAYSDPGYGHGDFAEMMNRRSRSYPDWPGFYNWAAKSFPSKPLMVAEWGLWQSQANPGHAADFYASVARQMALFPRVKAMIYFETPSNQDGRDSRVHVTVGGLTAYQELGRMPVFQVEPLTLAERARRNLPATPRPTQSTLPPVTPPAGPPSRR